MAGLGCSTCRLAAADSSFIPSRVRCRGGWQPISVGNAWLLIAAMDFCDQLPEEIRLALPLKRVWMVANQDD